MKSHFLLAVAAVAIILPGEVKGEIPTSEKGHCVWYDRCPFPRRGPNIDLAKNCLYNGTAKTLNDTRGVQLLQKLCPQYAADRKTCCSTNLLDRLEKKFAYLSWRTDCPACYHNIMNMLCQLTCAPDQSLFMETKPRYIYSPSKSDLGIIWLDIYIPPMFKKMLTDSCRNVHDSVFGGLILEGSLCQSFLPYLRCTPERLFKMMFGTTYGRGKYINAIVSFPDVLPKTMKWMDIKAHRCNESFVTPWNNQTKPRCSCRDCPHPCPRPTPGPKYAGSNSLVHKKGYCIWYDKCQGDEYCLYNGPAKTLNDTKGIRLLKEMCPQFSANNKTCCSTKLLDDMRLNVFHNVDKLTKDCPACHQNLMTMYCELICSPDQSLYVSPQMVKHHNAKAQITQLNYYVSATFKKALYDSCKDVILPYSSSRKALDTNFLCAQKPTACTPQKLVENMGRKASSKYLFSVLYPESLPQNMTWMDKTTYMCNKRFTTPWKKQSRRSCRCEDCTGSCPKQRSPQNMYSQISKLGLKIQQILSNIAKKAVKPFF